MGMWKYILGFGGLVVVVVVEARREVVSWLSWDRDWLRSGCGGLMRCGIFGSDRTGEEKVMYWENEGSYERTYQSGWECDNEPVR